MVDEAPALWDSPPLRTILPLVNPYLALGCHKSLRCTCILEPLPHGIIPKVEQVRYAPMSRLFPTLATCSVGHQESKTRLL